MLQDAKARFSEVIRRAKTEGPQRVTVHGREEAVVVGVDDWRRLSKTTGSGLDIVAIMQTSPHKEIDILPERFPVQIIGRDIEL